MIVIQNPDENAPDAFAVPAQAQAPKSFTHNPNPENRSRNPKVDGVCPQQSRKVDVGLSGKENSSSHGARPVHLIISMFKVGSHQWAFNKELFLRGKSPVVARRSSPLGFLFRVWGPDVRIGD